MVTTSIFDLVQTVDTPQEEDLQQWISQVFPKPTDYTSFQLALQLEKLFEMSIFEDQAEAVHLLLQQGVPANLRGDWGTTPLMWATCLNHLQICRLLIAYGANQQAKSFSGKAAKDYRPRAAHDFPEYAAILQREKEIHRQVKAGYLKLLKPTGTGSTSRTQKTLRQIDNGKGVDELFKKIKSLEPRTSRKISVVIK